MKKKLIRVCFTVLYGISIFTITSCSKKEEPIPTVNINNNTFGTASAVVITTGAQSLHIGQKIKLTANFVDQNGNTGEATGITWSSSKTDVATINNGELTAIGSGQTVITATATLNGQSVSYQVILGVGEASANALFSVAPQAIVWSTNAGTMQLEPVYFGKGNPSYTYSSSNESIIKVSASGVVTFVAAGEANIVVQATGLDGKPSVNIPVLVIGEVKSTVPLPVARVTLTPTAATLFRGQDITFSAKAFNSANVEVSGQTPLWTIENDTNNRSDNALTIDQNGKVTAHSIGNAIVYATIKGIRAQSQVEVLPDTVILVNPYYVSLDPGATKQFTAEIYKVNRSDKSISLITNPATLKWEIPSFAQYSSELAQFDIATVDQNGMVTMKANATPGFSTAVIAYIPGTPVEGAALLTVKIAGLPGGNPGTDPSTNPGTDPSTNPGSDPTMPGVNF